MPDLKTALLTLHVAGVATGMGAAMLLDVFAFRLLRGRPVAAAEAELMETGGRVIAAGLVLLWLSGLGLLALSADAAASPKVQAKLVAVALLSLNGWVIGRLVLPEIRRRAGRTLFAGMPAWRRAAMLGAGSVSAASWAFAFLLGMVRALNHAAPLPLFLLGYAALVAAMAAAAAAMQRPAGVPAAPR